MKSFQGTLNDFRKQVNRDFILFSFSIPSAIWTSFIAAVLKQRRSEWVCFRLAPDLCDVELHKRKITKFLILDVSNFLVGSLCCSRCFKTVFDVVTVCHIQFCDMVSFLCH